MGCSHLSDLNMSSTSSSSSPTTATRAPLTRNPNTSLPQNTSLFALCNHQADGSEQSRTEFNGSSRWNPTPEQLLALEEMYRQGTRTPSADQIQQIATQLRRFGKIEGKNVFYWFQNHKARERQKRRREKETMNPEEKQHIDPGNSSPEYKKESGLIKTGYKVEQTKDWAPSSNCSKHAEESISMHRGVLQAAESAVGPRGWLPFDEKELRQGKRSTISTVDHMNATWQTPSSSSSSLMDTITTTSQETKFLVEPYFENFNNVVDYDDNRETQTLELFPLCRDHEDGNNVKATAKKDTETLHIKPINAHFTPSQFIEFLPLKN